MERNRKKFAVKSNRNILQTTLLGLCFASTVICQDTTNASHSGTTTVSILNSVPLSTADICTELFRKAYTENGSDNFQPCRCNMVQTEVFCSNLDGRLPKFISFPKSAESARFLRNHIESISSDTFYSASNIRELDLYSNKIKFIGPEAFKAFKNLIQLDLSYNNISNMSLTSLHGLTALTTLYLGHNALASISSKHFLHCGNLLKLSLKHNPLRELEPKLFKHLPNLEILELQSTLIKVVPEQLFFHSTRLRLLDLSKNNLTAVPTDALKMLERLKYLELNANPVSSVDQQAFQGLQDLRLLSLDRMPCLTKIKEYALGDLSLLNQFHCSNNSLLKEIDEKAFVSKADNSTVPLSKLYLRHNSLARIPRKLLIWNKNMELHINGNPLHCDCHIEWMLHLKLKNDFQNHTKCQRPCDLSGLTLSELTNQSLPCGQEVTQMSIMTGIGVLTGITTIVLIVACLMGKRNLSSYSRLDLEVRKKTGKENDKDMGIMLHNYKEMSATL